MGLIHSGVPVEYVCALRKSFGIDCFVETGTYEGNTTEWAAQHFGQVITIELSEALYKRTALRLARCRNIEALFGDTRQQLARIAPSLPPAIVWLDAHYSAGVTAGRDDECPLLGEIAALWPAWNRMYVLVDDARYFLAPAPPPHDEKQWPSLVQVIAALNRGDDRFIATFEDVIVSLPAEGKETTMQYIRKRGSQNEAVLGYGKPKPASPRRSFLRRVANRMRAGP
jgi:hypothetical protein